MAQSLRLSRSKTQILEIPELGDDGEGDITTQVAAPPKEYTQPRMQTISQLDRDVQYHLPNTAIDLSMLTMALSPADKVRYYGVRSALYMFLIQKGGKRYFSGGAPGMASDRKTLSPPLPPNKKGRGGRRAVDRGDPASGAGELDGRDRVRLILTNKISLL